MALRELWLIKPSTRATALPARIRFVATRTDEADVWTHARAFVWETGETRVQFGIRVRDTFRLLYEQETAKAAEIEELLSTLGADIATALNDQEV